jgi:beta-glucosidase
VINIASDVRWGRVEETYGEDPFLASEMSVAFVSEFENLGISPHQKHLIAIVGDGGRDSYPIHLSDDTLREIHHPIRI